MILLLSQHSKIMMGREGHGSTQAIKMKRSHAAPYKPQSHPLSAVLSFPASHLFLLGQGQCQHWKLGFGTPANQRFFSVITFHQQVLGLLPSLQVKQAYADPSNQEQSVCPRKKMMKQQRGEAPEKLLRQKQKGFDCWDFQELFQGSGSCCAPGRAATEPCKHLLLAWKLKNHQKTSPLK